MAKNVFILGAGFSAPAGAPLIYNFIPSAKNIDLENTKGLKESAYYKYFEKVFSYKEELKRVNATFSEDFDDIEKLYSYSDFECRYIDESSTKTEIRKSLIFMIIKTIDILTSITIPPSSKLYPGAKLITEFKRLKDPIPEDFDIYEIFALLLSGRYNLEPCNSSVITFNYDIILDNACLRRGINPYYCLPEEKAKKLSLKILKLHGSANWMTCANVDCKNKEKLISVKHGTKFLDELINSPCPECKTQALMPLIVPPSWDKTQFKDILGGIWKEAGKEIQDARRIFIIGYSLPEADLYFRYLLYTTLSFNKNDPQIFIIDKDGHEKVKERLKEIFTEKFYERHVKETYSDLGVEYFINNQLRICPSKFFKNIDYSY